MSLHDLLLMLDQRDIKLFLKDDKLNYSAPAGAMTAEIKLLLKENKPVLIKKIQQQSSHIGLVAPQNIDAWPASFSQVELWQQCRNDEVNIGANRTVALRFKGNLSLQALEQSLAYLWQRHHALRTVFIETENGLEQGLANHLRLPFRTIKATDLGALPMPPRDKVSHLCKAFCLDKGPLCDFLLLELGVDDYLLTITLHQLITDGWSFGLILGELSTLYKRHLENKPIELPPLPLHYAHCLSHQEQVRQQQWSELNKYWESQLLGCSDIMAALQQQKNAEKKQKKLSLYAFFLEKDLCDSLRHLSQEKDVTLFSLLLAGFNVLLKHCFETNDITVLSPVAIRDKLECEKVLGCFVNHVFLRNKISDNQGFVDFLQAVNQTVKNSLAHKAMPYESVLKKYPLVDNAQASPVVFALQNMPMDTIDFDGLALARADGGNVASIFDLIQWNPYSKASLNCLLNMTAEGCSVCMRYDSSLLNSSAVTEMAEAYRDILSAIVQSPAVPVGQLCLAKTEIA